MLMLNGAADANQTSKPNQSNQFISLIDDWLVPLLVWWLRCRAHSLSSFTNKFISFLYLFIAGSLTHLCFVDFTPLVKRRKGAAKAATNFFSSFSSFSKSRKKRKEVLLMASGAVQLVSAPFNLNKIHFNKFPFILDSVEKSITNRTYLLL